MHYNIVAEKHFQKRCKSLKDSFRRELQLLKVKSDDEAPRKRKYIYFDQLSFLSDTMIQRDISCNYSAPLNNEDVAYQLEMLDNSVTSRTSLMSRRPKAKMKNSEEQVLDASNRQGEKQTDEDKLFPVSLIPKFKKLGDEQKLEVKI